MTFTDAINYQIARDRTRSGERFRERTVTNHTIGDFMSAVLAVDNAEDAKTFYDGYLAYLRAQTEQHELGPEAVEDEE